MTRVRHFMAQTRRVHCQWVCVRQSSAAVPKVSGVKWEIIHLMHLFNATSKNGGLKTVVA